MTERQNVQLIGYFDETQGKPVFEVKATDGGSHSYDEDIDALAMFQSMFSDQEARRVKRERSSIAGKIKQLEISVSGFKVVKTMMDRSDVPLPAETYAVELYFCIDDDNEKALEGIAIAHRDNMSCMAYAEVGSYFVFNQKGRLETYDRYSDYGNMLEASYQKQAEEAGND